MDDEGQCLVRLADEFERDGGDADGVDIGEAGLFDIFIDLCREADDLALGERLVEELSAGRSADA